MITVEGLLELLEEIRDDPLTDSQGNLLEITSPWDCRFISDVSGHAADGRSISTSQGAIALKLFDRYRIHLNHRGIGDSQIDQLIASPQYAHTPYQSTYLPREVRWMGDGKLAFRCKYNQGVVEDIKSLKSTNHFQPIAYPAWIKEHKLWIVNVTAHNIARVMDVIQRHKFDFDDDVARLLLEVENGKNAPSEAKVDHDFIVVNVRDDEFLDSWINAIERLDR